MWFLQTDILLLMLVCSLCAGAALRIAGKWNRQGALWKLMPLLDLGVIWYVSEKLAAFYAGFALVTFAFTWWLSRVKRGRRLWFTPTGPRRKPSCRSFRPWDFPRRRPREQGFPRT